MRLRHLASAIIIAATTSLCSWAAPVEYTHPKKDVLSGECTVTDEGVTYHSMGYPSTPPTYYGGYVRFKGETEGDPVSITFTEFDCLRNGNTIVFLYDGDEILKSRFTGYSAAVPAGYMAALTPECVGTEYTAESGVLCVLFAPASKSDFVTSPGGAISGGYTATLSAGIPKDMEYAGATAEYAAATHRGARAATLLSLTVSTEGKLNPFNLDALEIDIAATAASGTVENIRLISGSEVLATAAQGSSSLKAGGLTLKNKNTYTVVADVLPDATGSVPAPAVSSFVAGGESRTPEGTPADIAIEQSIYMTEGSGCPVYTIDDATTFFDAGGPDGVIPLGSEGCLTFVPATEGMRVEIDFSALSLFDTSSVGYNDILRIYNGRETSDENLIAELLSGARKVRSSAPDGSLTVYFKSTQGNASQCRPGWEAAVSQFTPTQMSLAGIDATPALATAPFAGQKEVQLFTVNVRTTDQLEPLPLGSFSMNLSGSAAVSACKVYALGQSTAGTAAELFGECSPEGTVATVGGEYILSEGDNYFTVVADIAENAPDASECVISLTGASVGGTAAPLQGECAVSVDIDNTCRLAAGSHSHKLFGDWRFINAPASEYSSNYAPGTSNCTVTFYPQAAGAKAQIAFDSFEVYYASTSYGTKAVFEVYSGDTADASQLIWKLSDNSQQSTGPGRKLRSQAADGAITVKFNPNTSSSYYCSKGWSATVTEFIDHDATVTATAVSQPSTAIMGPGSTDERILDFDIITEGTLNPLCPEAFSLGIKGAEALSKIRIYRGTTFENAALWGECVPAADATTVSISPADGASAKLDEEHNFFYVTVDVKDPVDSDIEVDASLLGISFGTATYTVSDGNPEGSRLTKNIYICESGVHTVTVDKPIVFYDEGGPEGGITKNFSGTITFVPASASDVLTLSTSEFGIGTARMIIYSGREANEANILGKSYYSGVSGPKTLVSKADDGSVTIVYTTQSYSSGSGFAIAVSPVAAVPFAIAEASVSAASELDVVRGSQDAPLAKAAVTVEGTRGALVIERVAADFSASTSTADIMAASLFFTGTADSFSATSAVSAKTALEEDGSVVFTLNTPVSIDEAGTYYFWVGADLSSDTEPGHTAAVAVNAIGEYSLGDADSASRTIVSGMGGTYRIGRSDEARFSTIAAAVQSLSLGVEAPVVFEIEDGTYAENVYIADVEGTSAAHPVSFTSLSGERDKVIIAGAASDAACGAVTVSNAPYIRFSALTIAPAQSGFLASVYYTDSSRGGMLDDCIVRSAILSGVTSGSSVIRTAAGSGANTNCDGFTVSGCYIEGGYIGIYAGGSGIVSNPKDSGLRISGNTISSACSKGMYVYDCENFTIEGNSIIAGSNARKSYNGMDVYRPTGSYAITGNKISSHISTDNTGIYIRMAGGSTDASRPALVACNAVNISASTPYTYGIMFETTQTNVLLAHNTVRVEGAATLGSCYALSLSGRAAATCGVSVLNNILVNSTKGGALRTAYNETYANVTFGGNIYYGNNGIVDSDGHTLAEYQELTSDTTSAWLCPDFASATDLHLASVSDEMLRERLDAVSTDADGTDRNAYTAAGAYEYVPLATGTPEIAEGYPAPGAVSSSEATVNTRWSIGGILYSAIFEASQDAPDAESLMSGNGMQIEADAVVPVTFKGLTQLTEYRAAFMVISALGEASQVVLSEPFTTTETIYPLALDMDWEDEAVEASTTVIIEPLVGGGKAPLSYVWTDKSGHECGNDASLTIIADHSDTYRLTVTSADGQTATGKAHVAVITAGIEIADFEDLAMPSAGWWKYDELNDEDTYTDSFFSGSFRFPNYPMLSTGSWCGFGYACETATEYENLDHQFRNAVGGGAEGTASYGVAYLYGANATIAVGHGSDEHNAQGVFVTNSAYTLSSILNGDGFNDKFTTEAGDYMTAIFTGYDADGLATGSVEVALADFRTAGAVPELLTDWKWVDLSPLGDINTLRLTYDSSKRATVPAYVCIDRLGRSNPELPDDTGTGNILATGAVRISSHAPGCLSVTGIDGRYRLDIYTASGVLKASHILEGASTTGIAELPSGLYIATVRAEGIAPVSEKIAVR